MPSERLSIPCVNLQKFYRVSAFRDTSARSIAVKPASFKQYINFRDFLFNGVIKAQSLPIFIEKVRNAIFAKIVSSDELALLENKPFNPMTIRGFFDGKDIEISNSSAKNLLTLLNKIHLIDQVNVIKKLDSNSEIEEDKNLIYNFLLRSKNLISLKKLKSKFGDHVRKHKINDYLIELWAEGKLDIDRCDVPREICRKYGIKDLPPEEVGSFNSIETYRIRESGVLKARVILRENYKLFPIIGREE